MTYDNTKVDIAINNWIKASCKKEFGETYAGDLLNSFIEHCQRSGDLKRSPGRVVFGKLLADLGYEKRKLGGLTYWAGITLVSAPEKKAEPASNTNIRMICRA